MLINPSFPYWFAVPLLLYTKIQFFWMLYLVLLAIHCPVLHHLGYVSFLTCLFSHAVNPLFFRMKSSLSFQNAFGYCCFTFANKVYSQVCLECFWHLCQNHTKYWFIYGIVLSNDIDSLLWFRSTCSDFCFVPLRHFEVVFL